MGEVIVGGWYAVYEIFEDDGELLDEDLGFFGEREGPVVDGGEIEVFEDSVYIVYFGFCFAGGYD
jgi:hypothetical protein